MDGFFGKTSVEKMVVPSNIKTIKDNAFDCTFSSNWTFGAIEFSEGLTSVAWRSFSGAEIKKELVLPSTLTTIGEYAFDGAETPSVVVKGNVTIKNYGLRCTTQSVLFCGNVHAGNYALPEDAVETIVVKGDFESGNFFSSPRLKTIEIYGNATFEVASFRFLENLESLVVKGDAYFPEGVFSGYLSGTWTASSPKKITVGGNAVFEKKFLMKAETIELSQSR